MKIDNVKTYDIAESIIASGLPMIADYNAVAFETDSVGIDYETVSGSHIKATPAYRRAVRLASAPDGSGHKTFLAGCLVSANVTATNAWWLQFGRYHFAQIVSSQSKMHRIRKMVQRSNTSDLPMHEYVTDINREIFYAMTEETDRFDDECLVYNCPMGLELTARITTNYLQLRTIYLQRRNHRLLEWRTFCNWVESLPFADDLVCGTVSLEG